MLSRTVQRPEHLEPLEGAGEAEPGELVRPRAGHVLAVDEDPALVGLLHAGGDVEQRRLARAVRPDEADDLPVLQVEADLVDREQAAEADADVPQLQPRAGRWRCAAPARAAWSPRVPRTARAWPPSAAAPAAGAGPSRLRSLATAWTFCSQTPSGFRPTPMPIRPGPRLANQVRKVLSGNAWLNQANCTRRIAPIIVAADRRHAAHHQQQQVRQAHGELEVGGADRAVVDGEQAAGQAGDRGGEHEHAELGQREAHAEHRGRVGAVPQRDQPPPEAAPLHHDDDHADDAEQDRGEDQEPGVLRERDPEEAERVLHLQAEHRQVGHLAGCRCRTRSAGRRTGTRPGGRTPSSPAPGRCPAAGSRARP